MCHTSAASRADLWPALVKDVHDLDQADGQAGFIATGDALQECSAGITLRLCARCVYGLRSQHCAKRANPDARATLGTKCDGGDQAVHREDFGQACGGASLAAALHDAMQQAAARRPAQALTDEHAQNSSALHVWCAWSRNVLKYTWPVCFEVLCCIWNSARRWCAAESVLSMAASAVPGCHRHFCNCLGTGRRTTACMTSWLIQWPADESTMTLHEIITSKFSSEGCLRLNRQCAISAACMSANGLHKRTTRLCRYMPCVRKRNRLGKRRALRTRAGKRASSAAPACPAAHCSSY